MQDRAGRFEALEASPAAAFDAVRQQTLALCEGLSAEDLCAQSMPDASPLKWHLAHTTWFFDEFLLQPQGGYRRPAWAPLFNSYYQSVGKPYLRAARGLLTRPALADVLAYRREVDAELQLRVARGLPHELLQRLELGLEHERQHQELMLTDIKHLFAQNPLEPALRQGPLPGGVAPPLQWLPGPSGVIEIGGGEGFRFDNEQPRHRVWLEPYVLANRPVTNGEFRDFIHDGGYRQPQLWLSDGWIWRESQRIDWRESQRIERPLYWFEDLASSFTLRGRLALDPNAPVCHLNYYEADAYARWAGARLPTEAEWEVMAAQAARDGNGLEQGHWHPVPAADARPARLLQAFGDVWEWTASAYGPYPGYRAPAGALGEYNGKFMCGQWVLRGGSCATPASQRRPGYRNFFYPADRWQFSGLRLARDS